MTTKKGLQRKRLLEKCTEIAFFLLASLEIQTQKDPASLFEIVAHSTSLETTQLL